MQGDYEPVADYITCMQALCDRLEPPWSLEERLNYTHRNMLPQLKMIIQRGQFHDFETLERLAISLEVIQDSATRCRAPTAPERALFPELAYHPPKKISCGSAVAAAVLPMAGIAGAKKPPSRGRGGAGITSPAATSRKCWNCEKTGHFAWACLEPCRLHCFRCGKLNVTVRDCPTCSGNAETSR
ncbi:hypothetical protein ALC57_05860 [Trachymyrmex cornetzi]|uniref:CCHC-type domain-containing protein n=1 Tax=Trachymyrmex cornetzi TaxID=471704 RepID=A0A151JA28_9HYME|nr:hypothetical protein ALC57_05860 [Trachymyrmex cornetzi]